MKMSHNIQYVNVEFMNELYKGTCEYRVEKAISQKGNEYTRLVVTINGKEFYKFLLLDNRDIAYLDMLLKGAK